jgi:hypothetical protein
VQAGESESKTLGNPPFALHVKVIKVICGKADGEELELAKNEVFQVILEGGKLTHQAVALRRIGRRKFEEESRGTIVGRHVGTEVVSERLDLFAQLIKPDSNGSRPDTNTTVPGVASYIVHGRCARMEHDPFVEGDPERAVLLHMNAQGRYGNITKAHGRAFDSVITRESLPAVAMTV